MHIEALLARYPAQLSGGQRQRVAVARALAVEPAVLLMDEPLSNLDALLRLEMRAELKSVLAAAGTTTLYVTHDQTEAMGLADRIAVMHEGRIVQIAPPVEVYRHPRTRVRGRLRRQSADEFSSRWPVADGAVQLGELALPAPPGGNGAVMLGIRPEDLALAGAEEGFGFRVQVVEPLGPHILATGEAAGQMMRVAIPPDHAVRAGESLRLRPDPARIAWMDPESGLALGAP